MNTNIISFTILDVSKVFSWPHNHLIHWSYMIASINIYKSTFHVTMYKNEMKFYMLMFMNAWMMLMLMKCKCQMQCLTLGCYSPSPYRNLIPRFTRPTILHKKRDKLHTNNLPIHKWHLVHCGYSTPPCRT